MKVLIVTQGTRGDVQPFIALAEALSFSGHEVLLGAPLSRFYSLSLPSNVELIALSDIEPLLTLDPYVREAFETNYHGLRGKGLILPVMRRFNAVHRLIREEISQFADTDVDVVVHHVNVPAHEIAERIGVPAVPVCLGPSLIPTKAFVDPMIPINVPKMLYRFSYRLALIWLQALVGNTTKWRETTLDLPYRKHHRNPLRKPSGEPATVLQAYSRFILPLNLDYPSWVHTTGFWFPSKSRNYAPCSTLERFVSDGAPPVYVGFGSVVGTDPRSRRDIVYDAVKKVGVRAVIVGGSGGIETDSMSDEEDILNLDSAPFAWLFPKTAAIVHHGGSGTTAEALVSGRPQVVCPAIFGQHFNAAQMYRNGVSPIPQPQHKLTSDALAESIHKAISNKNIASRSAELGRKMSSENGTSLAVEILESLAA